MEIIVAKRRTTDDSEGYFPTRKSLPWGTMGYMATIFGSKNFI